jgi:hypothetical protein
MNKSKNDPTSKNTTESLKLEVSSIGLMINYKTSPVVNSKVQTVEVNRNSKPLKARAMTTNQIKSGPVFEVKGENLKNQVYKRNNSISSESSGIHVNDLTAISHKTLLPKINNSRNLNDYHEANEDRRNSAKSAFDAFSIALVGTKPYQMSRVQQNNAEINSLNGYHSSPPLLNMASNDGDYFSNQSDLVSGYGDQNRKIDSLVTQKQIFFKNNDNSVSRMLNAHKMGLRIHHPKTKLSSLSSKNQNVGEINSFQIVAVPAIRPDEYLNSNDQYLSYYDENDDNENHLE